MKVIICVDHNLLMEPSHELSKYVKCAECSAQANYPVWFPIRLSKRLGTWESKWVPYTHSGWKWEKI